ncbi:hypothetical protein [Cuneatibacter caecimuris]|uniref:Uncharacterized protein n=1 Tax=Cuneatibacter caecimuris TaxID=1796618 RepID=A0A4V2F825_9FIRM|nr:hypothetical protein [Cuneatibacter caecimuris]RZT01937.1 hypothetical protein EV209_0037 [Cuneatibacter caecimuris]
MWKKRIVAVVLTLIVVMSTSVAAMAAVDKFAADLERDTLAGVYRTSITQMVNYYSNGYRARMTAVNKRSGNYAIVYVTSNLHSNTGTFTGAGIQDFASTGANMPTFTARLSADRDAGAFGYVGIKAVVS